MRWGLMGQNNGRFALVALSVLRFPIAFEYALPLSASTDDCRPTASDFHLLCSYLRGDQELHIIFFKKDWGLAKLVYHQFTLGQSSVWD